MPDAEALPLVLVHGYLGGSAQWAELEAGLAGRFRTVALDLPGFGRASGHPAFEALAKIGAQADPWAAEAALTAMATWDGRAGVSSWTMPSLVVWGDRDRSYRWPQVEHLWTHLPAASLAVIPGASHAAHVEKPKIFQLILEDFLSG